MKVLYDHLGFMEKYGGVSRYYSNMIQNLDSDIDYSIAVKFSSNEYLPQVKKEKYYPFIKKSFSHKDRIYSELNKPNSIHHIKKDDYDIYHMTHVDPYGFKYVPSGKKKVMTIHDLNFVMIPGIVSDNFSLKVWQRESVDLVDAIITVSENTKKDMVEQWNISEDKITVIYHGSPVVNLNEISKINIINDKYILYVGSRANFKNFNLLVKSFSNIVKKKYDLKLVCTGSDFSKYENEMFESLDVLKKVIHVSANDTDLFSLYNHALCYVYPSLYEGFGMPLLEAMACKCPVVCSNASCFPEIAKDAALYFDPKSENEIIDSIIKVIDSKSLRDELILKGTERAKSFSWKKCGKEHSEFYKRIAQY